MSNQAETKAVVALLAILAEQCGEKVSEQRLAYVASEIMPHGTERVIAAIKNSMRSVRRFPTVMEIEREIGVGTASMDPEAIGREVAERIYLAIKRIGSPKPKRHLLAEYVGPIGMKVIEMGGGWDHICATTEDANATIVKAQWREFAAVLAEKAKRGDIDAVPGAGLLDKGTPSQGLTVLRPDSWEDLGYSGKKP